MKLLKMNSNGQITIPSVLRNEIGCGPGDYFEVRRSGQTLRLVPRKVIDPAQGWFWTKEWQQKEKEADEDIKKGRYQSLKDMKSVIKMLKKA